MPFMWKRAVAAVVGVVGLVGVVPTAHARGTASEVAKACEVARVIAGQIPGARLREGIEGIDPLLGVPGLAELTVGRGEVMADPNFWVGAVSALLKAQC
jgi:hypothetical protein